MQKWVDNLRAVENESIRLVIVTANNHYAGFGSGTVLPSILYYNTLLIQMSEIWSPVTIRDKYSVIDPDLI
jgi:hypothetical protein